MTRGRAGTSGSTTMAASAAAAISSSAALQIECSFGSVHVGGNVAHRCACASSRLRLLSSRAFFFLASSS